MGFQTKSSTPENSTNFCQIPSKFQGQKPRPLDIPHYFFLVTHGNFTPFLINRCHRNSTRYLLDTPANSISSHTPPAPPVSFFFQNSPFQKGPGRQELSFQNGSLPFETGELEHMHHYCVLKKCLLTLEIIEFGKQNCKTPWNKNSQRFKI